VGIEVDSLDVWPHGFLRYVSGFGMHHPAKRERPNFTVLRTNIHIVSDLHLSINQVN
jgi:hypothetical protein